MLHSCLILRISSQYANAKQRNVHPANVLDLMYHVCQCAVVFVNVTESDVNVLANDGLVSIYVHFSGYFWVIENLFNLGFNS